MYTDPYVKASGKSADAKELRRLQKRLAAVKKAHNTVQARRIEREIQALESHQSVYPQHTHAVGGAWIGHTHI